MKNLKLFLSFGLLIPALAFAIDIGQPDQPYVTPHAGGRAKFAQLDLSQSAAVKNQLPVPKGGTGLATVTTSGLLYGAGTSNLSILAPGSQYQVYQAGGSGVPTIDAVHLDQSAAVTGTLPVTKGGTGVATNTANSVLVGNGTSAITSIAPGANQNVLISNGTTWSSAPVANTYVAPTIQKFTSGSGTYTLPSSVLYIRVKMVGAGGGGGGGGTAGSANGGAGGTTTFGTTLLSAGGGSGGAKGATNGGAGGAGGAVSLGSGPVGTDIVGGKGGAGTDIGAGNTYGGSGAASALGGGVGNGTGNGSGAAGATNSGGGGNGGGGSTVPGAGGGGAGGWIDALIYTPSATYAYAVGAAGSSGTAGTNGNAGGAGGSGLIEVTEYYQ